MIAFWATPKMSLGHLVFAIRDHGLHANCDSMEERDLANIHGESYSRLPTGGVNAHPAAEKEVDAYMNVCG
jgi:hypothetical protein